MACGVVCERWDTVVSDMLQCYKVTSINTVQGKGEAQYHWLQSQFLPSSFPSFIYSVDKYSVLSFQLFTGFTEVTSWKILSTWLGLAQ